MSLRRAVGVGLSAYELVALATGRVPALTDLLRLHRVLSAAAVGWLAVHLLAEARDAITEALEEADPHKRTQKA
jgi:hypothetical protein